MNKDKIPVIVINLDCIDVTLKCISHLRQNTDLSKISITVIDNGSIDAENLVKLKEVKNVGEIDQLISFPRNLGFSLAVNIAVKETKGKIFCVLNNDCFVESNWLDEAVSTFEAEGNVAAVCSNVYDNDNDILSHDDLSIPQLNGALMFIKREAWDKIGCFDYVNYSPAYSEETDWSYRAKKSGYKLMHSGKSLAFHMHSVTANRKFKKNEIHLIRLTNRIKCRLINFTVKQFLTHWKSYIVETKHEFENRTLHVLLLAFLRNTKLLPKILVERRKRFRREKVEFVYQYELKDQNGIKIIKGLNPQTNGYY